MTVILPLQLSQQPLFDWLPSKPQIIQQQFDMLLWAGHWGAHEENSKINVKYKSAIIKSTKVQIDFECKLTGPYQQHCLALEYTFRSSADKNSAFHEHHSLLFPPMLCHFPVNNGKGHQCLKFPKRDFPVLATITWKAFVLWSLLVH